jgi:predicted secreted protein
MDIYRLTIKNKTMETTTPQGGIAIVPVVYPLNEGTATFMSVLVLNFPTDAVTATTYWQLLTDEGKQLAQGNYTLTEEEFAAWGTDNSYVNQCVADAIGVVII